MNLKQKVINALPAFKNEKVLVKQQQGTEDIINYIVQTHYEYESDYDKIYKYFDSADLYETCRNIWNFLKNNLVYDAESSNDQSVKSPSAILHPGEKTDCKHYALFAGGVLDAIKNNERGEWEWCYRFASDKSTKHVSHVFVVVTENGREYWIDPCLTSFDQRKNYILIDDVKPMSMYKISGPATNQPVSNVVIVDKDLAFASFLTLLGMDFMNVKTLMLKNMAITSGPVKSYMLAQGLDYDHFINFLNS